MVDEGGSRAYSDLQGGEGDLWWVCQETLVEGGMDILFSSVPPVTAAQEALALISHFCVVIPVSSRLASSDGRAKSPYCTSAEKRAVFVSWS